MNRSVKPPFDDGLEQVTCTHRCPTSGQQDVSTFQALLDGLDVGFDPDGLI